MKTMTLKLNIFLTASVCKIYCFHQFNRYFAINVGKQVSQWIKIANQINIKNIRFFITIIKTKI